MAGRRKHIRDNITPSISIPTAHQTLKCRESENILICTVFFFFFFFSFRPGCTLFSRRTCSCLCFCFCFSLGLLVCVACSSRASNRGPLTGVTGADRQTEMSAGILRLGFCLLPVSAFTWPDPGPPHRKCSGCSAQEKGQRSGGGWRGLCVSLWCRLVPTECCGRTAAGPGELWRSWFPRHDDGTSGPSASAPPPGWNQQEVLLHDWTVCTSLSAFKLQQRLMKSRIPLIYMHQIPSPTTAQRIASPSHLSSRAYILDAEAGFLRYCSARR